MPVCSFRHFRPSDVSTLVPRLHLTTLTAHPTQLLQLDLQDSLIMSSSFQHAGGSGRWRVIAISAGGRHSTVLAMPDSSNGSQTRSGATSDRNPLSMPPSSSGRRSPTGASDEYDSPVRGSSNEEEEDELLGESFSGGHESGMALWCQEL